ISNLQIRNLYVQYNTWYNINIIGGSQMNKKGFTLIELLAVILVLGVIALIAIPIVTNMIE
ncbi:MAG TPA: prepilin-type N-terminal cleavage/methylation domain-containing protein, partial [Bacilli bacterium]|nr:prepilin-type N-terminal cleavage/methylation domain-containing protein [Bacilli bacterium]